MKKIKIYSPITQEQGVIAIFSSIHKELGFPKLVSPKSTKGFDIDDIEYKNGERVTVEFEYQSRNFIRHGHIEDMVTNRNYVVICYEDDCNLTKLLRQDYNITNVEVIELKDYVEYEEDIQSEVKDIQYYVLSYNPKYADNKAIDEFAKTHMYGTNAPFSSNYITPGSKILFKQDDYIVAECTVVRYEQFDIPKTENEWKLYKCLYQYPFGIFTGTEEEMEQYIAKGYIFYDNFKVFKERKISFKNTLPNRKFNNSGKININKEEYTKLLGN